MSCYRGANRPYFERNGHQNYQHNFQRHVQPQYRPYPNRNSNVISSQQSFNNPEHWCETCDRGFNTLQQLEGHKQQHEKCNIDGCQFVAHPKVITKHIQMQHSSGLYKRIAKLDNPEEIKKWIEERKKKYPTKANIDKKTAEIKEKIERGEKMGLRQNRFQRNNLEGPGVKRMNPYHNGNCNNQQVKRQMKQNNWDKSRIHSKVRSTNEIQPKKVHLVTPIDNTRKLRPFTGIQNIDMDSDSNEEIEQFDYKFDIEDDDDSEILNKVEQIPTNSEPTVCGALSSLMCTYGSSDEENEVSHQNHQNTRNIMENNNKDVKVDTPKLIEDNKGDEDSGPEETKVVKGTDVGVTSFQTATSNNKKQYSTRKQVNRTEHKKHMFMRTKPKVPSTLLHKLLHREVQHERNVILQCVRYIVKNNYFDK